MGSYDLPLKRRPDTQVCKEMKRSDESHRPAPAHRAMQCLTVLDAEPGRDRQLSVRHRRLVLAHDASGKAVGITPKPP